jgi:hypothetical protein
LPELKDNVLVEKYEENKIDIKINGSYEWEENKF